MSAVGSDEAGLSGPRGCTFTVPCVCELSADVILDIPGEPIFLH